MGVFVFELDGVGYLVIYLFGKYWDCFVLFGGCLFSCVVWWYVDYGGWWLDEVVWRWIDWV